MSCPVGISEVDLQPCYSCHLVPVTTSSVSLDSILFMTLFLVILISTLITLQMSMIPCSLISQDLTITPIHHLTSTLFLAVLQSCSMSKIQNSNPKMLLFDLLYF